MGCRHALETLTKEAEMAGDTYKELRLQIDNTKRDELGKAPRFVLVQRAVKAVADLAAHPHVDTLDRKDTAALIAMVAGILHQGSELT